MTATLQLVMRGAFDATLTGRLPRLLMQAGFVDVSVEMDADLVYTVVGAAGAAQRENIAVGAGAARPHIAGILGGDAAADAFVANGIAHMDRPDTI